MPGSGNFSDTTVFRVKGPRISQTAWKVNLFAYRKACPLFI
jgi:hypothetical protein